ncbi:hypothetical protein Hesp01_73220 [Herbidospora sp. NBRC 101105]|nr:hypothetical protein Hesp01_73220 [Herbidospora sp. NBRC 101105]
MLLLHLRSDLLDHRHNLAEQLLAPVSKVDQRRNVHLRDHHDVHRIGGLVCSNASTSSVSATTVTGVVPGMAWWQ